MNVLFSPVTLQGYAGGPSSPFRFARQQLHLPAHNMMMPAGLRKKHHQWPWRFLAFASDLGTVGYLIKQPVLNRVGWLISVPYYAYGLWVQPNSQARKEEMLYQLTANGALPFVEAKIGVKLGTWLYRRLPRLKVAIPLPAAQFVSGLLALAVLTPMVGDPISQWMLNGYKQLAASTKGAMS